MMYDALKVELDIRNIMKITKTNYNYNKLNLYSHCVWLWNFYDHQVELLED